MTLPMAMVICVLLVVVGALAGIWMVKGFQLGYKASIGLVSSRLAEIESRMTALESKEASLSPAEYADIKSRLSALATMAGLRGKL